MSTTHKTSLMHHPVLWDAMILILLIAPPAIVYKVPMPAWLAALLMTGSALVFYGSFIESRLIKVNKKSIHISGLHDLKIAVIADFHVGPYKRRGYVRRIVKKANALQPHLILLPGDFIFDHASEPELLEPLKDLRAPLGVYASIGNHDSGNMIDRSLLTGTVTHYTTVDRSEEVTAYLRSLGITVLRNEHHFIEYNHMGFAIAGADEVWMKNEDLTKTFEGLPVEIPTILLAHNPDIILEEASLRSDLIVSGHTHGGQIRLPILGSIYPIPDALGRAYDRGIFQAGARTTLAITQGIGETMARARLFCMPEVMLLEVES